MSNASVLIIEDRPEIAARLRLAVEGTAGHFLAVVAGTLDQGLQLIFERKPRVVLVDIGLPDGSGIDADVALPDADWEVDAMIMSIFGEEARVMQDIQAGAQGCILKGGDMETVSADILSLLDDAPRPRPSEKR